eukprot:2914599-Amphidinium_carterae.1
MQCLTASTKQLVLAAFCKTKRAVHVLWCEGVDTDYCLGLGRQHAVGALRDRPMTQQGRTDNKMGVYSFRQSPRCAHRRSASLIKHSI